MCKVVVTEYLSPDGVMEYPAWTAPYWGDDIAGSGATSGSPDLSFTSSLV